MVAGQWFCCGEEPTGVHRLRVEKRRFWFGYKLVVQRQVRASYRFTAHHPDHNDPSVHVEWRKTSPWKLLERWFYLP